MDYQCSQFVDFEEFAEFSASSSEPSNGFAEFVPQYTHEENFEEVMAKFEGSLPLESGASLTTSAPPATREEIFEEVMTILGSLSNEPEMVGQSNIPSVAEPLSMHEEYFEEVMAKARDLSTERPTGEPSCDTTDSTPIVSAPKCTVKPVFRIVYKESPYSKTVLSNMTSKNSNKAVIKSYDFTTAATKELHSTKAGQKEESRAIIDDPIPTLISKVAITTAPPKPITKPASEMQLTDVIKEQVTGASTVSQRGPASNVQPIRLQSTAPRFRLAPTVTQISLPQPKSLIKLASTVPQVRAKSTVPQMVSVSTSLKSQNKISTVPQVGNMSLPPQPNLPTTMPHVKVVSAGSQLKAGSMNHQMRLTSVGVTSTSQTMLVKTKPNEVVSVPTGIKYVTLISKKPQVGVMSLSPQTSLPSTMPHVKVSAVSNLNLVSTKPQIRLASIVPKERVMSTVPILKVTSNMSQITSTPTMSNVKVISTVPHVTVASKIQQRPSSTMSHVKAKTTGPNVKTVLKQPQINWTRTTLPLSAMSTVTQTRVTSTSTRTTSTSKLVPKIPLKRKREEPKILTEPVNSKAAKANQTTVRNETTKRRLLTYDALCKETLSDYVDC